MKEYLVPEFEEVIYDTNDCLGDSDGKPTPDGANGPYTEGTGTNLGELFP